MNPRGSRFLCLVGLLVLFLAPWAWGQAFEPRTEITKWQDGKQACVSLTFDDNSLNQFRIGMPLLNERGFQATFFIITGNIPGSQYRGAFVGRPPSEILQESESVPTNEQNALERMSLLYYQRRAAGGFNEQQAGRAFVRGQFDPLFQDIDEALARLRQRGLPDEDRRAVGGGGRRGGEVSWETFRQYAALGHEFASHTVTHPYMSALDEANCVAEIEQSIADIRAQLGPEHTFSIECPYGIHDERIRPYVVPRVPLTRNWVTDDFMDEILRGSRRSPGDSEHEYVQWQRGPLADTTLETMNGWVDTAVEHGVWLVLVFHGIEGIGWEALPTERVRAHFDYIQGQQPRLWVATFQEGGKYARQRMSSEVATCWADDAIEVTVTHTLDPEQYDLPLTARTAIPTDWNLVRFRQGEEVRWIPVHREDDATFVLYRIQPNGGPATLERGD